MSEEDKTQAELHDFCEWVKERKEFAKEKWQQYEYERMEEVENQLKERGLWT